MKTIEVVLSNGRKIGPIEVAPENEKYILAALAAKDEDNAKVAAEKAISADNVDYQAAFDHVISHLSNNLNTISESAKALEKKGRAELKKLLDEHVKEPDAKPDKPADETDTEPEDEKDTFFRFDEDGHIFGPFFEELEPKIDANEIHFDLDEDDPFADKVNTSADDVDVDVDVDDALAEAEQLRKELDEANAKVRRAEAELRLIKLRAAYKQHAALASTAAAAALAVFASVYKSRK